MKKLIILLVILFSNAIQCMYDQGGKLPYDEITLANKSKIPFELSWHEIKRPQGIPTEIKRTINAGETIRVKIGEVGGYDKHHPAKVTYFPINHDDLYKRDFALDLPSSQSFILTAVSLADVMKNIWVPGVLQKDDKGAVTFQYKTLNQTGDLEGVVRRASNPRVIK